jgi:uncharacterized membrane protein
VEQGRLTALTDGVGAIIITVMVLEPEVPLHWKAILGRDISRLCQAYPTRK